jgi:antitoxin MazE
MMLTRVQKWGNSIALRIPKAFAEEMRIAPDSPVELSIEDGKLLIVPVRSPEQDLEALLAQITGANQHDEVDWGAPTGKETW